MKKIISIVGGTGFLGSHLIKGLVSSQNYSCIHLLKRAGSNKIRLRDVLDQIEMHDIDTEPLSDLLKRLATDIVIY